MKWVIIRLFLNAVVIFHFFEVFKIILYWNLKMFVRFKFPCSISAIYKGKLIFFYQVKNPIFHWFHRPINWESRLLRTINAFLFLIWKRRESTSLCFLIFSVSSWYISFVNDFVWFPASKVQYFLININYCWKIN